MSAIQYLLEENVDPLYRTELLRREPEMVVWRVGMPYAPPDQTPDPEILRWCEQHGFILVTNNRKSMPTHLRDHAAEGRHVPGVFILNPNMSIGAIIEELILIGAAADQDEYQDGIEFLPVS
jgi:hypothetical protein